MARVRFGTFEYEQNSGRLWKDGHRVKLQPKSAGILAELLGAPGQVVTRENIRRRLWPDGTYVDFDRSINVAVKRLRDSLCDSTSVPLYIATVPGEGYRFIADVTNVADATAPAVLAPIVPAPSRRRLLSVGIAAALFLVCGAGMYFALRGPAIQLHRHDWILIADFDNRTGEKLLDGTLQYAVEREISNSQFVNVVPHDRVQDALRLMKKPLDATLDRETARQVCLRDGAIKAILTGRIEKLGTNYVLSVQIIDPSRDVVVTSLSEEDPADTLLAQAVRKLSARVRKSLGEQELAVQLTDEQLAKVTTPSLHALQLYTQADRMIAQNDTSSKIAAELLEQAIQEDPNFASAHMLLGYAYSDLGRIADAAPHFRRAFELANTTTERERYFILASYYGHPPVNQVGKAAELYETLLRRYPDHRWALNNLADIYLQLGKGEQYDELRLRLAALRPNDLKAQLLAGWVLVFKQITTAEGAPLTSRWTPDFRDTQQYLDRAIALRNAGGNQEPGYDLSGSPRLFAAEIRWMDGNISQSRADVIDTARFGTQIEQERPYELAPYFAAYGNLHEAERRAATQPQSGVLPILAFFRDDVKDAERLLRQQQRAHSSILPLGSTAMFMAKLGREKDTEAIWQTWIKSRRPDQNLLSLHNAMRAELALFKGDIPRGTQMLDKELPRVRTVVLWAQIASEDLARAYEKEGRPQDAVRVLERAAYGPTMVADFSAMWQERIQWDLGQLYRELGRGKDADRVEDLLRTELAFADPDHPIVLALRDQDQTSASNRPAVLQSH